MRTNDSAAVALGALLAVVMARPASVDASEPPLSVRIAEPPTLSRGSHASLRVEVALGEGIARPLLVTPRVEGQPIEVVRGRLLRADARDGGASTLVFDVPIRVVGPGTAVVHVEVAGYACATRCQHVAARAQRVLNVSL